MKLIRGARQWVAVTAVVSALMLAAAPVAADNWGANGYASGGNGPPPSCDNLQTSECIANDGLHYVYFFSVETNQYNDTKNRMYNVYDPIVGVVMYEASSQQSWTDVIVMDGYYGTSEYAGWTQCTDGAAHGGSGRWEWCQPQLIMYNLSQTDYFSTQSRRRMIACHEMGHTLGLQHRQTLPATCMHKNADTSTTIPQEEIGHLEYLY